jgi:hypothetical protein
MFVKTICRHPFLQVLLKSNGDLMFCEHQEKSFGNLTDSSFDDLWFGELADEIRVAVIDGNKHANCLVKDCPILKFVDKIEYGEYPAVLVLEGADYASKIVHLIPSLARLTITYQLDSFQILDDLKIERNPQLMIEANVGEKLNLRWLEVPNSTITFNINYYSKLTDLYLFSKERKRDQKLIVKHKIQNLNLYESLGIVHIAKEVKADSVEFDSDLEIGPENCGLYFKLQQDIIEECLKLNVFFSFVKPLDRGLFSSLVIL